MMNIIWLTPEIPFPPIGGRNGVYNRIVQLSKYNNIFLFSIAYSEEEKNSCEKMEKYCKEVHYYNRNENKVKKILKSLILPYSVASRTLPKLKMDIKSCFNTHKIDVVITDFPNMANNILGLKLDCYCTLNQHNNEYIRMRDMCHIKTLPLLNRVAYFLESYRLELFEKKIYNSNIYNSITFFSVDDCEAFKKRWSKCQAKLKIFPLGANKVVTKHQSKDINHNTFLFVGRLDSVATTNVEAITWFCHDVLPIVEKKVDINIVIAGSNPCDEVMKLKKDNVIIIPNYEDLDSVYTLADYVILPILSGGGVKGKLLEAAAYGKVIISTKHGIEGTYFEPEKHVLYGNSNVEFANKCIEAVRNLEKSHLVADNAKELYESRYEWGKIGVNYNKFLNSEMKGFNR